MALPPPLREPRKVQVRVIGHDRRATGQRGFAHGRRHNHAAGQCGGQLRGIAWVGQEGQAVRVGRFQRGQSLNHQGRITTAQLAAQSGNDLSQPHRCGHGCGPSARRRCRVQRLDHLLGDIDLGTGEDHVLNDQVVLLGIKDLLDDLVGTLDQTGRFFIAALV